MKAIKIKPILFKEGNFVYPLFDASKIKRIKYAQKTNSTIERKNKISSKKGNN